MTMPHDLPFFPGDPHHAAHDGPVGDDNEDSDSEYEYGFVLSDEWRGRFERSLLARAVTNGARGDDDGDDGHYGDSSSRTRASHRRREQRNATTQRRSRGAHEPRKRGGALLASSSSSSPLAMALAEASAMEHARRLDRQPRSTVPEDAARGLGIDHHEPLKPSATAMTESSASSTSSASRGQSSSSPSLRRVQQLETVLAARFEEFCDAHSPIVWPQG